MEDDKTVIAYDRLYTEYKPRRPWWHRIFLFWRKWDRVDRHYSGYKRNPSMDIHL